MNSLLCISLHPFLSEFITNFKAANHLITTVRTEYGTKQKSLKYLTEIMTLVSSANNITSDIAFILLAVSLMYIMNNRGPRMDRWGTACLCVPQLAH